MDIASDRQRLQLEYISQFSTDIVYVTGDQNIVAGTHSKIKTIQMPTKLTAEEIAKHQETDTELHILLTGKPCKNSF